MMLIINQATPSHITSQNIMATYQIKTPIGLMTALADERILYFLHFADDKDLEHRIQRLIGNTHLSLANRKTDPICAIEDELMNYFDGKLKQFKTPICFIGTEFQKKTWQALAKIPYGTTQSYSQLATCISRPGAFRAVAQANGRNPLAIIIPCHRVINANGDLGGYNGGLSRKQWLLDHEKNK